MFTSQHSITPICTPQNSILHTTLYTLHYSTPHIFTPNHSSLPHNTPVYSLLFKGSFILNNSLILLHSLPLYSPVLHYTPVYSTLLLSTLAVQHTIPRPPLIIDTLLSINILLYLFRYRAVVCDRRSLGGAVLAP